MPLEDFFTLTEMKDGLSTLGRVEELVSMMQEQSDSVLNNLGDAVRQWSAIAHILAATENKDCLNHFVKLNGLCCLNRCLQEALNYNNDVSDNVLEGLITSLLAAFENLTIDGEILTVSGIGVTVECLLSHRNIDIKEKAKKLSDKWNNMKINVASCHNLGDKGTSLSDHPTTEYTLPGKLGAGEASCKVESTGTESQQSNVTRCSDSFKVDTGKDLKMSTSSNSAALGDTNSLASSLVSNSCPENLSVTEDFSVCPAVGSASAVVCKGEDDGLQDVSVLKESFDGVEGMEADVDTMEDSPHKLDHIESCNLSSSSGLSVSLPAQKALIETNGSLGDVKEDGREADSKASRGVDSVLASDASKSVVGQMDQKLELGFEYEEIDALEVARQVAIEVEREVVDYREPFCSSPEVNSGETAGTCSPDAEGKQDTPEIEKVYGNRSPAQKELLDDASSPKEHQSRILDNIGTDPKEHEHSLESPKPTSIARCDFDLNDDIFTEEFDGSMHPTPIIPVNLSAPIAVVAASKGAPSLPVTPLRFEGGMGWKGSAATSAFRPASPRRTPDCDKTHSGRKQKPNFLEIDLNVAEGEDDVAVDPTPAKQMLVSGDSSMEVSSRRAERLKLDLNRLGDEDISMAPSPSWRLHHQNGDQNLSSASSSSSRQPSMRDFDLNDDPCFAGKSTSKTSTAYGSPRVVDDPAINIVGSRMSVERKDYLTQAHRSFLGNGLHVEAMMAARPPLSYAHMPPPYGYNGHTVGPTFFGHGGIPYMVDSRGATIVPQVLGSAGLNSAPSSLNWRPHFLTTSATTSMNRIEPSRSGWDLNLGTAPLESGVREVGGLKQLFKHGNSSLVEEQTRTSLQPSSSGMGMKRKEPDCGWEPYAALGYNR